MGFRTVFFVAALLVLSAICAYAEYMARVHAAHQLACATRRAALVTHFRERQRHRERAMTAARRADVLRALEASASPTGTWADWMDVAALYATGSFPDFAPNPKLAASIYHAIAVTCDDAPEIANHARALVTEMPVRDAADVEGDPLPTTPGEDVLLHISSARLRPSTTTTPKTPMLEPPPLPPPPPPPPTIRNDPQNAHDHGVVASLQTTLDALPRGDDDDREASRDAVERALFDEGIEMDDETKAKALTVLHGLRNDHAHSGFGVTELEALDRVWAKIGSLHDDRIQHNAIETLGKQLASAHERGTTVCSTGKIARVLGSLDGIANETTLKPIWAVRDELNTLAAKVRSSLLEAASPAQKAAYGRGDAPDLEGAMRDEFTQKAFATYCDSLGMSKKIITSLSDPIADAF